MKNTIIINNKPYQSLKEIEQGCYYDEFNSFHYGRTAIKIKENRGSKYKIYFKDTLEPLMLDGINEFTYFYEGESIFEIRESNNDKCKVFDKKTLKQLKIRNLL
jgi:hypothetical protein